MQLTFDDAPLPAFEGMPSDSGFKDFETGLAETAFDSGMGLVRGTTKPQVKLPGSASDITNKFQGVSVYQSQKQPTGNANRYAATDPTPVLRQGRIWVKIDPTVGASLVNDGPVFCVHSGVNAGMFRGDAGSGSATQVPRAVCRTGGLAGGIAEIALNLP